ncbi:GntP family permease [Sediminibacillus massiliensis]|uniref:GntP family permease n=1 Tax=Sediminibacillus massiliensis TaxID=1926277 RepID=UPI0009883579|nr:gluconate:H+ symporter [Sediminibacillus massiliensis]
MSGVGLILVTVVSIIFLLFLVIKLKVQAFVALLLTSILVGLMAGMPFSDIIESIESGMGGTLGFVATVVGLGAMFGAMLEVSGGAERIAQTLLKKFGEGKAQWALVLTGFLVAIPVFFDVGFIILMPLVYTIAKKAKKSLLYYGIPLLAGLSVTHTFIPPTPGPIAVADLLGADLGWVILFGTFAAIPAAIVAGPVFGKYIAKKIYVEQPDYMASISQEAKEYDKDLPKFSLIVSIILIPLVLILLNTVSGLVLPEGSQIASILGFLGNPIVALIITTLFAFYALGKLRGYTKEDVQKIATKSLEPAGIIILVTGAGGVFKQVLIDSGVGDYLGGVMAESSLPPVILAFLISAAVRIIQGSATVAMITAAGLMSPIIQTFGMDGAELGLMTIAVASGSLILSHVNDSGFWLFNRYFGMSEKDTLKSWTIMDTLISLVGFAAVLVMSIFV